MDDSNDIHIHIDGKNLQPLIDKIMQLKAELEFYKTMLSLYDPIMIIHLN